LTYKFFMGPLAKLRKNRAITQYIVVKKR